MKHLSDYNRRERALIAVGIALIAIGAVGLLAEYSSVPWWHVIVDWASGVHRALLPVYLIAICVVAVLAQRAGVLAKLFSGTGKGEMRRTRDDRRVFGVCGGIAAACGVNCVWIRITALIAFLALPGVTTLAYVIATFVFESE